MNHPRLCKALINYGAPDLLYLPLLETTGLHLTPSEHLETAEKL